VVALHFLSNHSINKRGRVLYKKYITKKGKRIGPYYYDSVRLKDGRVKTVYLGRNPPQPRQETSLSLPSVPDKPPLGGHDHHYLLAFALFMIIGLVVFASVGVQEENEGKGIFGSTVSFGKNLITGLALLGEEVNETNQTIITKEVNLIIDESSMYDLLINADVEIESIAVSGEVLGEGTVNIYLDNKDTLIYSNNPPLEETNSLTGLAVSPLPETNAVVENMESNETGTTEAQLTPITGKAITETNETLPEEAPLSTTSFEDSCLDTCDTSITKKKLRIIIEVDDASLNLATLKITLKLTDGTLVDITDLVEFVLVTPATEEALPKQPKEITAEDLLKSHFVNNNAELVIEENPEKGNEKISDLLSSPNAERGPDWIRVCNGGMCTHEIYSSPIFMLDKDGKYKLLPEIVKVTQVDGDTFKVNWWDNEVTVSFAGAQLIKTEIEERGPEYEWAYYYNHSSNETIPYSTVEANKAFQKDETGIILEGVKIGFQDAVANGFDVTPVGLGNEVQAFALEAPPEMLNNTGQIIEIDPTISLQNAPNITEDGFVRKNLSSVPTYERFTTGIELQVGIFGCNTVNFSSRGYIDFNTSSIPDNVVISQVNLTLAFGAIDDDATHLNVTKMDLPGAAYSNDATGNLNAFNDMDNVTYAQFTNLVTLTSRTVILGGTAANDLQNNLTTGDMFSLGLRTNETGAFGPTCAPFTDRFVTRINSTDNAFVASRPVLTVTYDLSVPEIILNAPANNSAFNALGNITLNATVTDKNQATVQEVVFFGLNQTLPTSSDILSIQLNVTNGTALTYNWTVPVTQKEGGTTLLLVHFDNRTLFGENTTVVNDYSNYNFDGVVSGAIFNWTSAILGGAYNFDGANDNINFGDQDALIGFNRTYLMWINPTSVSGTQTIVEKLTDSTGLRIDAVNTDIRINADGDTVTASNVLTQSAYTQIGITINATGYTTIYRNGVAHTFGSLTSITANAINFILGETASGTQDFNGLIDEFAIINRTYSALDVRNSYRLSSGIYYWYVNATDGSDSNFSNTRIFNLSINDPPTITLNNPANNTIYTGVGNITLDVTIDDINNDTLMLELFGTNTTTPTPEDLLLRKIDITPQARFVYNWTAPVLHMDTDYQLLAHMNNQSIFFEDTSRVYNVADPTKNGTLTNGILINATDGKLGGALHGTQTSGQYLNFGDQGAWVNVKNLTYLFWVSTSDRTGIEGIIAKGQTGVFPARDLVIRKNNADLQVMTGGSARITLAGFFRTAEEWRHLGIVFSNSVDIKVYTDGVLNATGTNTSFVSNTNNFIIGNIQSAGGFVNPFSGLIDEVAIINRSLTATEVLDAYRLRGGTYRWFGNVTDGIHNISSQQRQFTIVAAPTVSVGPTLTPNPANTTDQLNCTFTVSDTDAGEGLSANISFYNGSLLALSFNISVTKDLSASQAATSGIQAKIENWTCGVVPFDGTVLGNQVNATAVTIVNSPPNTPTLTNPAHNNVTTDTTPFFNWTPVLDPDNDVLNYTLNITCIPLAGGSCGTGDDSKQIDNINISNYTLTDDLEFFLDDGYRYNWTVRATDGQNTSAFAKPFNISFVVFIDINLSRLTIDFGSLTTGTSESTVDNSPLPLKLDNNGNSYVNVNLSALTMLFAKEPTASNKYMYKVTDPGGQAVVPFNTTLSATTFTNITILTNTTALVKFNETATVNVDINITIPLDEPQGLKSSILQLFAWYPGR